MLNRREFIFTGLSVAAAVKSFALPTDRFRWSISSHMFTPMKPHPESGIKMAARFGFHGIEPWWNELQNYLTKPPQVFKDVLDQSGISISSVASGGEYVDPSRLGATLESHAANAKFASYFGCKALKANLNGRHSPADLTTADAKLLAKNLNEVGKRTLEYGIKFAFHPHAWSMVDRKSEVDMMLELTDPKLVYLTRIWLIRCTRPCGVELSGQEPQGRTQVMSLKYWLSGIAVLVICGSLDLPLSGQSGAPAAQRPAALPTFKLDPSWPPKLPNDWGMGQMSGVAVDQHDNVWLIHRPRLIPNDKRAHAAPPVLEFDANGKFLQGWGGSGTGYEWPENEHGIYVDGKDVVWISGQAGTGSGVVKFKMLGGQKVPVDDDMLLKFTTDGRFLQQIGHQNQSGGNKDTKNLKEPAEFLLYRKTNELFVADGYGNSRIIVLDPETGAFKRMWGAFGKTPADAPQAPLRPGYSGLAEPEPPPPARGAAPAARAAGGGAPAGGAGPAPKTAPGPDQFGDPLHSVKVSNDELVYAADRTNGRVQVFTLQGKYITQLFTGGSPGGLALSPDAQQQFLYVGDGARILVVARKTMQILSAERFGPRGSVSTHLIAIDSKGNIYTTELDRGTHRFLFTGMSAAAAR